MSDGKPLLATTTFRLGTVGAVVTERFVAGIAEYEVKAKHVGLLAALSTRRADSQLELARLMDIAPSLVVRLADHLEELGAIERVRDPDDRRRQVLRITDRGARLLASCTRVARSMERDILAGLSVDERAALRSALRRVAGNLGLPDD